jgi:hypothetical protein
MGCSRRGAGFVSRIAALSRQAAEPTLRADERKPWTILFYLCGDNPLDGLDATIERELQQILGVGSSTEAYVAVQRDSPGGCARWLLPEDRPADIEQPTRALGRTVDSASPDTLRDFLLWGLERCPSECLALIVSGAGILDDRAIVGTPTNDPDRVFTICDDWTERSGLEIRQFADVLREVSQLRARRGDSPRLEIVAFDMCRMQFLEVAAELHDSVELLIGPQTNIDGWDYDSVLRAWLRELRDGWRPDRDSDPRTRAAARRRQLHELTDRLVAIIGRSYTWTGRDRADDAADGAGPGVVVSALDLTQMERAMGAVDTMSLAYMQALGDRLAWDARVAAVTRLGALQDRKSYDAHAIFREVSRALDQTDIDAGIAAYTLRWMCQAEPRELLRMLAVMDEALTTWLLEDADAATRRMGARRRLLELWVRPACEEIRRMLDQYEGQSADALDRCWALTRTTHLDALAVEFGFASSERLLLVIASQQHAWHERRRRKRATDPDPVPGTVPGTGPGVSSSGAGGVLRDACAGPPAPPTEPFLTARELADPAHDEPGTSSTGIVPHALRVWVRLLERCAADDALPAHARAELAALLRERKNARHLRRLVGRARMLLAPPRPARRRRGERLILSVFPPPAPPPRADQVLVHRSGLSLYRPLDLAELTRASYLALQFNQRLHWTALLTAIHLIADRPNQLWQVLSSLLASARERGRQELLAQLAGPDAVLRVGSQFKAFAPVPLVTLSLEREAPAPAPASRDDRPVYLTRLMSSGREAIIHEQRCRVNQALLDRLLADLDHAVGRDADAVSQLDALGSMLGEDIVSALAEHLEAERQQAGAEIVHLQLQLPRDLLHYPWEIVRDRHGTLGTRYAVARQVFVDVGLSGGQRVRRAPRRERLRVLIIGNPAGANLPWAQREAEEVLRTFRALQQESGFIDIDADEDVFIGVPVAVTDLREWLRSGRYDVVHFCGHAHFDAARPERSAWVLSDGMLEAEQIRNTLRQSDSPPWLVYANACSAGREQSEGPFLQDVTGLASAFVNAGVAAYVGPLWPIRDSPACDLATHFYDQLVVGRSTLGTSLREARAQLLDEGSYTWASLVLYGDSTATLMQRLGALLSSVDGQASPIEDRRSAPAPARAASRQLVRAGSREPAGAGSRLRPFGATASRGREPGAIGNSASDIMTSSNRPIGDTSRDLARAAAALAPDELRLLRSHVVNLREGRFSSSGRFSTSAADVDAIFSNGLTAAWDLAQERGEPLHVVLWAHGGLIDEASGLAIARNQVRWWLDNRVYPIFFVWETGFFDALQQILSRTRGLPGARDVWDHTTDLAVEAAARAGGVGRIWGAMKRSAELAVDDDGGARYVARKLAEFGRAHGNGSTGASRLVLHAVGHSAGSIFHSQFLPAAFDEGVPDVEGLYLLAPAVRTDTFKAKIPRHVGNEIGHVSLFTMNRDWEEADSVGPIYRKSLLYLVSRALEAEAVSPILGLETSLRADPDLVRLFGLDGPASPHAEVIWSVTASASGRGASTSTTHGGFDNNAPTMNSVLRRMLGRADGETIVDFPRDAEQRAVSALAAAAAAPDADTAPVLVQAAPAPVSVVEPAGAPATSVAVTSVAAGRRRALCVGIDDYAMAPLAGCVADATDWRDTLVRLGFETTLLTNRQATRQAMLAGLTDLVSTARAGDIVVFQYAGHGTQFDDLADEPGDEDDGRDEAFCPADMDKGAYVIDDDVRAIFATLPDGVNLTCFLDCCHSGSITRALGAPTPPIERASSVRPRFIRATPEMEEAHRAFRAKAKKKTRSVALAVGEMRQVVFSACQDREVAYESDGHGDFTRRAIALLRGETAGMTHESFQERVIAAFGAGRRQNPNLECAPTSRVLGLLQPLIAAATVAPTPPRDAPLAALSAASSNREIADLLRRVADVID